MRENQYEVAYADLTDPAYEPDPDDFTKIAYETDFYMKAVDFEL